MKNKNAQNGSITSGSNMSYWLDSVPPISFASLDKNIITDIVIVGGGIAGVTIAYALVQSGKQVVLVEDGNIGSGETGRTTAHLVTSLDDRYFNLEHIYGENQVKIVAESHKAAIDFIERTIKYQEIECEFERVDGYLFLHPTDKRESLSKELKAAERAGVEVVQLPMVPGTNEKIPCLKFYNQAQFHPIKYLNGLSDAIIKMGGAIYTGTHVDKIDETGIVTNKGYKVRANHIIIATNSPVNNKYVMHLKQYPYRSYVIGAKVKKDTIKKALWWDTGDHSVSADIPPYHYVRIHNYNREYDLLICGGEDHPTGIVGNKEITEEDRYALLEHWARQKFPIEDIVYQWSGQIMEPMDALGYIGRNPMGSNNIYIVSGDSGNGMTNGTIAGILIPDIINGKENKWEKIYDPSRFKFFSAGKIFFKELVGGMFAYLKNKPQDIKSIELTSISVDEGKIVEFKGKKLGAYRDTNNVLHTVDAECSHLKCIIKWNNDEKSWDCPCHGSRFTYEGKVVNGPANSDLSYHSEKITDVHVEKVKS